MREGEGEVVRLARRRTQADKTRHLGVLNCLAIVGQGGWRHSGIAHAGVVEYSIYSMAEGEIICRKGGRLL